MMGDFTDILNAVPEFKDPARRESYVNTNGMEIIVLTPLNGSAVIYMSSIQMQTTQGPMNLQFPLMGVDSIDAACAAWQAAARTAIKSFGEKLKENQRRIVVPGSPVTAPFKTIN